MISEGQSHYKKLTARPCGEHKVCGGKEGTCNIKLLRAKSGDYSVGEILKASPSLPQSPYISPAKIEDQNQETCPQRERVALNLEDNNCTKFFWNAGFKGDQILKL